MYHVRLNRLAIGYINVWRYKRDMTTRNDGHPSFDHDPTRKISLADPC